MKRVLAVLKNLGAGLVGALWLWIYTEQVQVMTTHAFLVFGIVTVAFSLANLVLIGQWRSVARERGNPGSGRVQ